MKLSDMLVRDGLKKKKKKKKSGTGSGSVMSQRSDGAVRAALQTPDGAEEQTDDPKPFSGDVDICTAQTTSVNNI